MPSKPQEEGDIVTKQIIANGPLTDGDIFYPCGAILIEDRKIMEVGSCETLRRKWPDTPVVDVEGRLIIPGLTNFHHHLYSSLATGLTPRGETISFSDILKNLWWPLDFLLDEESIYFSALYGIIRSVQCGVTSIFDHHASLGSDKGSLELIAHAFKEVGIRGVLCFEVSDRAGEEKVNEQIEENIRFWQEHQRDAFIHGMLGLHANFTLSEKTLYKIRELKPKNLPIHIHCGEGEDDLIYCQKLGYKGPVHRLDSFGLLNKDSFLIHCIHLSEEDYKILSNKSPWVVTNPESNANNRVGQMDRQRITKFVIGTDGMSSDIIASLRNYAITSKELPEPFERLERTFWGWPRLIRRNTWGFQGIFAFGEPADITVLDYKPVTPIHESNIMGHLIFGARQGNAFLTMCNGKIIWQNGSFVSLHEEAVFHDIRRVAGKLHKRFSSGKKEGFPWSD